MEQELYEELRKLCEVKISEFHDYHNYLQRNCARRIRNGMSSVKEVKEPEEWSNSGRYNPFYVIKHLKQIAHSISRKLVRGTYEPEAPFLKHIPKSNGTFRVVMSYQLPDAAVSTLIYRKLIRKNRQRFSSYSYAYRNDRNAHFAIQDLYSYLSNERRVFVAEYDFSSFFDSILHDYLFVQLDDGAFNVSEVEKHVIDAFISNRSGKGIPQGTSISLFLANVSCWSLDRQLEEIGVRFARYADDLIVWSKDFTKVCNAVNVLYDFSKDSGVQINANKSPGISIICNSVANEVVGKKKTVSFLGHNISSNSISFSYNVVDKIKRQISYLIYSNLIQPLKAVKVSTVLGEYDKAFISSVLQVRRYLYGDATELALRRYQLGHSGRLRFRGLMSYFPLVDNIEQLKELDRWMANAFVNALHKREKNFEDEGILVSKVFPYPVDFQTFIRKCEIKSVAGRKGFAKIPSFLRIRNAYKKGIENQGIESVANPKTVYYNYEL